MGIRSRVSVGLAVAATGLAAAVAPAIGTGEVAAATVGASQASAATTVPYAPYPATGTELYVYNAAASNCSDTGAGSQSQPFCSIAAAANAVQPGQTVVVEPGTYAGATISVQGTSAAPITFTAIQGATVDGSSSAPALTVSGAHNAALNGFSAFPGGSHPAVDVTGGSSGITINGGYAQGGGPVPAVEVDGTSSGVTVSRMAIRGNIQVDPGASGVVISGNSITAGPVGTWGVLVTDAAGTDVTGNTVRAVCSGGISVAGASAGVTVENNIVQPVALGQGGTGCAAGTAISISAGSEAASVVGYDLIDPSAGGALYEWGGTSYTSLAAFQAASGQGARDIAANPGLGAEVRDPVLIPGPDVFWYLPTPDSPAIDSADASAPGELPTDQFGNPRTDDPGVVNSGTGTGYYDRGAVELEGGLASAGGEGASRSGPLTATFTLGLIPVWKTNGPLAIVAVGFGDGQPRDITRATTVRHTYRTAGLYRVSWADSDGGVGEEGSSTQIVVGADYTPVTPVRILDTRTGTGTGRAGPIAAGGTLTLPITSIAGTPAADISAVVMNVTVTKPSRGGFLTVYPRSFVVPEASNLNFSAGETVPNLVTVQVSNGEVSFFNGSSGTVQVIADLEGFYGRGGYGFQATAPTRVLDTRNGTGGTGPVPAGGVVQLNLSGRVPAGTTAVVMNVTVIQPKQGGFLTVYPDGTTKPNASNLNFSAGQTVPNLVIVPLTDGVADIASTSGGTVQVVADLDGYFAAAAPDSFVPFGPTRIADTRTGAGVPRGPVSPRGTLSVAPSTFVGCAPICPLATTAVYNVTVTQPKANGVLTAYPFATVRPAASNLNFSAGQTVANLVSVEGVNGGIDIYNGSSGSVQLVVDEYGYYISAS
jgi:Right handed beta helix region